MDVYPVPWFSAFARVFFAEMEENDPYPADPNHPHRVDPWRFVSTSLLGPSRNPRGTISWYKFRFNPRYMMRVFTINARRSLPFISQYTRVYFDRLTGRSDINYRMLSVRLDLENEREDENLGIDY